ncbi:unnamed protein product [Rotaria sordida]|uniref:FLYWCH-type domain-containing protein n=1 Tax=Rotaria sordida TaxID=392033 RepID=A0A814ZJ62_9BILA|nr:unnamed protein product [Rotaria sordida]CAF4079022.1 unnamed protein product [Rotaria sordida]
MDADQRRLDDQFMNQIQEITAYVQTYVRDNYICYVSKTTTTVKYWKCEDRSCNVGVHTNIKDTFIKTVGNHSHLQSLEEIEVRTFKQNIKPRVINETTAITKIYNEELARQQMSQTAAAIIPLPYEAKSDNYNSETNAGETISVDEAE